MTRRDFLQGVAGIAAAGAGGCAGLPLAGKPRKDGALIAILSDCHVGNWNSPKYQGEKLAECIARVLVLDPLPGKMLITGDLAYLWGRKEDYALSRQLLRPVLDAGIELTIAMGNHDRRENFLEAWPEYAKRSPVPGRIVSVVHGVHFDYLLLDTLNQPVATDRWITDGTLDAAQRDWLKAACAAAKRPFLVLGHHPAHEIGDPAKNNAFISARAFGEIIMGTGKQPTKCCGYIHGHDHQWYVTRSLAHWSSGRIGKTAALPSTGHWGDIGYALLREHPDRAELSLVQYDYFSPEPQKHGEKPKADWQAVVRDNAHQQCTFTVNLT